ncbi:MAG: Fic family protein [Aureispira sp.]
MLSNYKITNKTLQLLTAISERLGAAHALHKDRPSASVGTLHQMKTIQASLALEGTILTTHQITALLEGKQVLGASTAIQEALNTADIYQQLATLDPFSKTSFVQAQQTLRKGLTDEAKLWRERAINGAPSTAALSNLVEEILTYSKTGEDPILLRSILVHYEIARLRPFEKGNERIGRLWQTLLLRQEYPIFEYLPVEALLYERQEEYSQVLAHCNRIGKSTAFLEFLLGLFLEAMQEWSSQQNSVLTAQERLDYFIVAFEGKAFSRKDYRDVFKDLSSATASRDLKNGVTAQQLKKVGDKRLTRYQIIDGSVMKTAQELWANKEWRKGGVYELALEVCSNKEKQPVVDLAQALFELDVIQGPFNRDFEPAPLDTEYFRSIGYIEVGAIQVPFVLFFISEEGDGGSNWLDISIYTGLYEEAFGEAYKTWAEEATWNEALEQVFAQIIQELNAVYKIRLGLLGYEISGLYSLQGLKEKELPEDLSNPSTFFLNEGEILKGKNIEQVRFIGSPLT